MRDLRNSEKAPGEERIYTSRREGMGSMELPQGTRMPVPKVLREQMVEMRDRWGLDYSFPWDE